MRDNINGTFWYSKEDPKKMTLIMNGTSIQEAMIKVLPVDITDERLIELLDCRLNERFGFHTFSLINPESDKWLGQTAEIEIDGVVYFGPGRFIDCYITIDTYRSLVEVFSDFDDVSSIECQRRVDLLIEFAKKISIKKAS